MRCTFLAVSAPLVRVWSKQYTKDPVTEDNGLASVMHSEHFAMTVICKFDSSFLESQ